MISADLMQRIRRIELRTRRVVNASFAGAYRSVFRGRGIVFESVRPYQPGDDVRDIDWNVTARSQEAYVKTYTEERELTVMLVLDASASCLFGTSQRLKRDVATEVGAVLALSAIANNDKVGLLIFSEDTEQFIPPRKGRNHTLRLIRELLMAKATQKGTNIALALQTLNRTLKQHAIVFIISDFLAPVQAYEREIMVLAKRHDVIALMLGDPLEHRWHDVGLVRLRDAETDETSTIDTSPQYWREQFVNNAEEIAQARNTLFRRAGIDKLNVFTHLDYVDELARFFQRRTTRRNS